MFSEDRILIVQALIPLLYGTEDWPRRWDVEQYVSRCREAGFASTSDSMRLCAERYLAGKRRVTPPGTARKIRSAKKMERLLKNPPPEIVQAIEEVLVEQKKAVDQFKGGSGKVLNSLVGAVMKKSRADAAIVRELLSRRILNS